MVMKDNSALPDGNNVYGYLRAHDGMQPVLRAVRQLVGENQAYVRVSGFDGAETLRFSTSRCDFESTPLDERDAHLLNGGVAGSVGEVAGFVAALSRQLSDAGIEHQFEIYDENGDLAQMIPTLGEPSSKE